MKSNILNYIIDDFGPDGKPKEISIDLDNMSAEELEPYIGMNDQIRHAYAQKKITEVKNTVNNSTDTIETA
jgi:hypothetical protein